MIQLSLGLDVQEDFNKQTKLAWEGIDKALCEPELRKVTCFEINSNQPRASPIAIEAIGVILSEYLPNSSKTKALQYSDWVEGK